LDTVTVALYGVDSTSWPETGVRGITWNTKPAVGARIGTASVAGTAMRWYEFDVSDFVKARRAAGAKMAGFAFQGVNQSVGYASFATRSTAEGKPELILSDH
jgi:hypothetical protein